MTAYLGGNPSPDSGASPLDQLDAALQELIEAATRARQRSADYRSRHGPQS